MKLKNKSCKKPFVKIGIVIALIVVYLIVAIPFRVMSIIPGFTDIRPVLLLQPVYGVFFGIPGCIAFALGNLIGDILSDSLRWSSIGGFVANFIGPFIFFFYWKRISKTPFALRTVKEILKHISVIAFTAIIESLIITPMVALIYPDVDVMLFACTVLLNNSVFPISIGIPLMILMQEELDFKPVTG